MFTPIIRSVFSGERNRGNNTRGSICVPVLISQPALKKDHVHTTAASIVIDRTTNFLGHLIQTNDKNIQNDMKKDTSFSIQPKYSLTRKFRMAWYNFTNSVQNKARRIMILYAREIKKSLFMELILFFFPLTPFSLNPKFMASKDTKCLYK
jgi:hypothetical protein